MIVYFDFVVNKNKYDDGKQSQFVFSACLCACVTQIMLIKKSLLLQVKIFKLFFPNVVHLKHIA